MMSDNTLHLAIGVADGAKAGVSELKSEAHQKGVHLYEEGERLYLYPISQDLSDAFDIAGIDLDPEKVRLSLDWVDPANSEVKESNLTSKIRDVDFDNGTFQLFDLPTIISFVDSSQDLVDKEQADLTDKSEADDSQESPASDNEDQQLEQPDIEETSEPDDEAQLEDEIPDSFPDEENEEGVINFNDRGSNKSQDLEIENQPAEQPEEEDGYSKDKLMDMFDEPDDSSSVPANEEYQENPDENTEYVDDDDPFYQAANSLFSKNTLGDGLPAFDNQTKRLINSDLVDAQNHLASAKQEAISDIYYLLKDSNDKEYAEAEKNQIAQAQQKHDKNIDQIKKNNQTKLQEIENSEKKAYNKQKHDAGQAALNEFYAQYDADHLNEMNDIISQKSQPIREQLDLDIREENQGFDDYKNQVRQAIFNHVTDNADVKSIIEGYRQVIADEKKRLLDEVKKTKNENIDLKRQIADLKSSLEINKQTYDANVKAAIAKGINDGIHAYRLQVEDADNRRKLAEDRCEEMQKSLAKAQDQTQQILHDITSINLQNTQIMSNNQQMQNQSNMVQPQAMPTAQSSQTQEQHRSRFNFSHASDWKRYAGIVGIVLLTMSLSSIFTAFTINSRQPAVQQPEATVQSHTTQDNTAATNNSVKQSSSTPNTFTYTTKSGKKYAVIKDDDHSGHYIDDHGVSHTVLFR